MVIKQLLRPFKRISALHFVTDFLIIVTSLYISLYLRVGEDFPDHLAALHFYLPIILLVRHGFLMAFGCYSVMWRYISTVDAWRLAKAMFLSVITIVVITFFFPEKIGRLPRTVYVIDALLATLGLMGIRLLRRVHYEGDVNNKNKLNTRTLIYGAGNNGRTLATRFRTDSALGVQVVGFVDDDPQKQGVVINGIPVLGAREDLEEVLKKEEVSQLIIAIPNIPGEFLREVVQVTRKFNIRPRITTPLSPSLESAKKNVEIYRDVNLSDLLNRQPREIDLGPVREMIKGKIVLVTGAGGSIGSELARQIMSHEPGRLLLLDHSEYNLYEIDKELRLSTHDTQRVVPLMIDIKDETSLRTALKEYGPDVIFHAAAYKHVHLVESNPYPSILNNILGTKHLVDIAKETGVGTFLMISTDKAVNPAGVMGATKRICELIVTAAALETGRRYCSVRFGNVLGSSGSLIPLLKKQIEEGGPVTITHQDMTRFFMLIPEAVSLVLKAATIARPGDINVLKMGEPVKILDIAKSLIALMGKTEDDIGIVFTGLRPGEKMFEELYIRGDELKTEHPDILTLPNGDSAMTSHPAEREQILSRVTTMINAAHAGSKEALFELNYLIKTTTFVSAASNDQRKSALSN